jgi:hypothetical protein
MSLKLLKGTGPLAANPEKQRSATQAISWTDLANTTYTFNVMSKGYTTATGSFTINGATTSPVALTFARTWYRRRQAASQVSPVAGRDRTPYAP